MQTPLLTARIQPANSASDRLEMHLLRNRDALKSGKLNLRIGFPQRVAAVFLVLFLAQCLFVVHRQQLTETDYRFARCGSEMWQRPSPLAGYFTTCGNMSDGASPTASQRCPSPSNASHLRHRPLPRAGGPHLHPGHRRLRVGVAPPAHRGEVSAAPAVHRIRAVAGRRSVVGLPPSLRQ